MSTTTYKNVSEADHALVGFGVVRAGETVETDQEINHAAFEQIDAKVVKGKRVDTGE